VQPIAQHAAACDIARVRSVAWFAVYVLAVFAPLLVASVVRWTSWGEFHAGFGAASGWLAFALFALEFGLVTRVRAAASAFGSDALLLFHRAMGFAALGFAALHVLAVSPEPRSWFASASLQRSGMLAVFAALALIVTSVWRRELRWSYELWLVAHRGLAVALVVFLAWHLAPFAGEGPLLALLATYSALALGALLVQRFVRPALLAQRQWELVENRDEGARTRTLVLRAVGHDGLRFAPGQFVWLTTACTGLVAQEHPISIASSPELDGGRTLELAIKALGDWSSSSVPALKPGARVRIDGPFGAFTPDTCAAARLVLVAGGIGVTPMRSILLAMRDRGDRRPVTLIFAARCRSTAMFADELERLQRELALELVFVFEEPAPDERCETGLLSAELLRRRLPADLRFTHVFVCGPAPMMELFERIARELGIPPAQVHTERFDMV